MSFELDKDISFPEITLPAFGSFSIPGVEVKAEKPLWRPATDIKAEIRGGTENAYNRMRAALTRNLPDSSQFANFWQGHTAIICGGGPGLGKSLGFVRKRKKLSKKTLIVAPNRSHDWLAARGIVPDIGIMMDPAPWLLDYMTPRKDVMYFLGSALDPRILDKFEEAKAAVVLTHYGFDDKMGEKATFEREFPGRQAAFIYGCSTSGLRSIPLLSNLGVFDFILTGFDSCCAPNTAELYSYAKPLTKPASQLRVIKNKARGTSLSVRTNEDMWIQISDFAWMISTLDAWKIDGAKMRRPIRIQAVGDGAIPWMCFQAGEEARAQGLTPQVDHVDPESMRRKYGKSPHYDYAADKRLESAPIPH